MNHDATQSFKSLPVETQQVIVEQTRRLPQGENRNQFLEQITRRTARLVSDYRCTLSYTAIGIILGELIDQLLVFNLPVVQVFGKEIGGWVIRPTLDLGDKVLGGVGAWLGFKQDRRRSAHVKGTREALTQHEQEFRRIVREELERFFPEYLRPVAQPV